MNAIIVYEKYPESVRVIDRIDKEKKERVEEKQSAIRNEIQARGDGAGEGGGECDV